MWQIVVAALSPHLLNWIVFLSFLRGFSERGEFIHTDLTRDEDNVLEGKPIDLFLGRGGLLWLEGRNGCLHKTNIPFSETDLIRESEGCFLAYLSRNLIFRTEEVTSGRRTFRLLILSGYQSQTQKEPTLWPASLPRFVLKTSSHFSLYPMALHLLIEASITSPRRTGTGKVVTHKNARFG